MGLDPVSLAVIGTVIAAGSAGYSAYAQNEAANKQADLQNEQAAQEKAAAVAEAGKIREKGVRIAASQEAALAGSGVKLDGQGSGGALLSETSRLAEQDALAAITGGNNRAKLLSGEADISRSKGQASLISGGLNVGSTLLGGYNKFQESKRSTAWADEMNSKTLNIGSTYTHTKPRLTLLGG